MPCEELGRTFQQVEKLLFTLHYLYQAFQKLLSSGRHWVFSPAVCNLWWKNTDMSAQTSHFYFNLLCQYFRTFQFSSVVQSCLTLCNPMNRSTPGLPVHHQLLEFTQTHVHWVGDNHLTISSFVVPFSSCLQSFPTSGSFQKSQFFTSGRQRIGVSVSTLVLPMNTQDWSPLGWTGWISLQSKGIIFSL